MEIKINLNSEIKAKLTPKGYDTLRENYIQSFCFRTPENMVMAIEAYNHKVASVVDGFMTFQLWDFMNIFGPKLHLGSTACIEENNIYCVKYEPAV